MCPFNIHYRVSIYNLHTSLGSLNSMRLATSAYNYYLHFFSLFPFRFFFFSSICASLSFALNVASVSERRFAADGNLLLSFDIYFHAIESIRFSFPEFFSIYGCIISMILNTKLRINDRQQQKGRERGKICFRFVYAMSRKTEKCIHFF